MRRSFWFLLGLLAGIGLAAYWARGPLERLEDAETRLRNVQSELRSIKGSLARAPARLKDVEIELKRVAKVVDPVDAASKPGEDGIYVGTRTGKILKIDTTRGAADPELILDITKDVDTQKAQAGTGGEAGLLGFTFSPDGSKLYVTFTGPWRARSRESVSWTLVEFRIGSDGIVDKSSRRRLLRVRKQKPHHNGGSLRFGPDGYLYTSIGDGWPFGDELKTGQDPSDLLGSIIRIDPTPGRSAEYSIPGDNPFAEGGGAPEVWAYGVRNPWRFSFDRITGDLWIADVGDREEEEIDLLEASGGGGRGANLGWSLVEGTHLRGDAPPEDYHAPLHSYRRRRPYCAIIGGFVYRGSEIPSLRGAYLFSDYCAGTLRALVVTDDKVTDRSLDVEVATPSSFAEDNDGELYVISLQGDVFRIEPA